MKNLEEDGDSSERTDPFQKTTPNIRKSRKKKHKLIIIFILWN